MSLNAVGAIRSFKLCRIQPNLWWLVCTSWICCLILPAMLEIQHRVGVQHFALLQFVCLFLIMLLCAICYAHHYAVRRML